MTTLLNANARAIRRIVVKTSAGTLYRVRGNWGGHGCRLHFFDRVNDPVDGDESLFSVFVSEDFDIDFGANGRVFDTGIVVAASNHASPFVYLTGDNGGIFDVQYL